MKFAAKGFCLMLLCAAGIAQTVTATFPTALKNVIVIVQENRTPDNLFHHLTPLCTQNTTTCIPSPVTSSCYDVSNCGLSKASGTVVPVTLTGVPMKGSVDPSHSHTAFINMCDADSSGNCRNDGAYQTSSNSYAFVKNQAVTNYDMTPGHLLDPYLTFAESYGWANFMYQTNQGPSYPAHQFLFSATSALGATDDSNATFVSENFKNGTGSGCLASAGSTSSIITPTPGGTCTTSGGCSCFFSNTVQECPVTNVLSGSVGTFCVLPPASGGHRSMAGLLDPAGISWKYYAPSAGSIWTAPNAIKNICEPAFDTSGNLFCSGTEWNAKVDVANLGTDILTDIGSCNLSNVSWVIPDGRWSDHAGSTDIYGPSWVAAIINAIGNSTCTDSNGNTYWQDTAIFVTWDDWGGWSDNQPAVFLQPQPPCTSTNCPGDYQYGFRVPLLVVSAWTPSGYINNSTHDFGSILRMIEDLNGLGRLGFADTRANGNLVEFFSRTTARNYTTVIAVEPASFFTGMAAAGATPTAPDQDDDE